MSGYLVPISKSAKTKVAGVAATAGAAKVSQKTVQAAVKEGLKRAAGVAEEAAPKAASASAKTSRGLTRPGVLIPAGVLATTGAGTGAYLYRRKRVEKSLSLMQHDFPSVMMSTT
jgi:hypothetical protein